MKTITTTIVIVETLGDITHDMYPESKETAQIQIDEEGGIYLSSGDETKIVVTNVKVTYET